MSIPFNTFSEYFMALYEAFGSEDYGAKYPAYYKFCNKTEDADVLIIKHLLTEENAQESLDTFIEKCLEGNRYAGEFPLEEMIVLFLKKGAKPNMDRLFNPISDNLDDEIPEYGVRGKLIDAITSFRLDGKIPEYAVQGFLTDRITFLNPVDVSMYGDWNSIKAAYWQGTDDEFESTRLSHLKACSDYLQTP